VSATASLKSFGFLPDTPPSLLHIFPAKQGLSFPVLISCQAATCYRITYRIDRQVIRQVIRHKNE
jgi:hypothetical protein